MSMPAIFFVSDRATAESVELNHSLPAEDVAERSAMDTLKLATLWTILTGSADDPVELMERFTEVRSSESEWTNQLPDDFVALLAGASDSEIGDAAARWIETDEMMGWKVSEAIDLLGDVRRVAKRAQESRQP